MIHVDPRCTLSGLDQPAVLFKNTLLDGTLTASSETADGLIENLADSFTFDFWKPASLPAQVSVSGVSRKVNCICLADHELGSKKGSVRLQKPVASHTNLHLFSEDFSATGWATSSTANSTLTAANHQAPDGKLTAGLFECSTTASVLRRVYSTTNITVLPGVQYSAQIYVKAKNWTWVGITFAAGAALSEISIAAQVNLQTGQVVSQAGTQVYARQMKNGWWRIGAIGLVGASTGYRLGVALLPGSGSSSAVAAGVVGAGVYVWGADVQQSASLTSYIPTTSATAASAWEDVSDYYIPDDDNVLMIFTEEFTATSLSVAFTGLTVYPVGVLFAGEVLQLPCGVAPSYIPLDMCRDWPVEISRARKGQYLGNTILRHGIMGSMVFTPMPTDIVRGVLKDFIDHYDNARSFFLAAGPSMFVEDAVYVWRQDGGQTLRPQFDEVGIFMTLELGVEGIAE